MICNIYPKHWCQTDIFRPITIRTLEQKSFQKTNYLAAAAAVWNHINPPIRNENLYLGEEGIKITKQLNTMSSFSHYKLDIMRLYLPLHYDISF